MCLTIALFNIFFSIPNDIGPRCSIFFLLSEEVTFLALKKSTTNIPFGFNASDTFLKTKKFSFISLKYPKLVNKLNTASKFFILN